MPNDDLYDDSLYFEFNGFTQAFYKAHSHMDPDEIRWLYEEKHIRKQAEKQMPIYGYAEWLAKFKEQMRNNLYPDITECCPHEETFWFIDQEAITPWMMHVCKNCALELNSIKLVN